MHLWWNATISFGENSSSTPTHAKTQICTRTRTNELTCTHIVFLLICEPIDWHTLDYSMNRFAFFVSMNFLQYSQHTDEPFKTTAVRRAHNFMWSIICQLYTRFDRILFLFNWFAVGNVRINLKFNSIWTNTKEEREKKRVEKECVYKPKM